MNRFLVLLSFFIILISGSKPNFSDLVDSVKFSSIQLPESRHVYSAIWLSEDIIVFVKDLDWDDVDLRHSDYLANSNSTVLLNELYLYKIHSREWTSFPVAPDLKCFAQDILLIDRLPNGNLGLVQTCRENHYGIIREFDIAKYESRILFDNKARTNIDVNVVWSFAFSPDMTEWIQEDATGRFLNNQLYYIKKGETPIQIVPDFIRAMSPAWSPHKREIAFWGTENYKNSNDPELKTTWDIVGLAAEAWNLNISSPEGREIHLMLPSIATLAL